MGWGGTAVILNADRVGAQLKTIAPKLTDYRAVAADGVHTRTPHILWDTIWAPAQLLGGQNDRFRRNSGPYERGT